MTQRIVIKINRKRKLSKTGKDNVKTIEKNTVKKANEKPGQRQ